MGTLGPLSAWRDHQGITGQRHQIQKSPVPAPHLSAGWSERRRKAEPEVISLGRLPGVGELGAGERSKRTVDSCLGRPGGKHSMFGGYRQEWEEQEWVLTSKLVAESWQASAVSGDEVMRLEGRWVDQGLG